MTPTIAALMFGIGFGVWVYSKMERRTGGNAQSAGIVSAIAGIFAFVLMLIVFNTLDNWLG